MRHVLCLVYVLSSLLPGLPGGDAIASYKHNFEAAVLRKGQLARLPSPLYVVDVYMGGWNEYDQRQHPHLDLGSKTWSVVHTYIFNE